MAEFSYCTETADVGGACVEIRDTAEAMGINMLSASAEGAHLTVAFDAEIPDPVLSSLGFVRA